jgi:hypothetical protein
MSPANSVAKKNLHCLRIFAELALGSSTGFRGPPAALAASENAA